MKNGGLVFLVLGVFVIGLAGCATGRKDQNIESQGLKNQISVLEAQLQARDEEIMGLQDALNKASAEKLNADKIKVIKETKSRPNAKQIQLALTNAGYNPGSVDGKIGNQTKEAIKAFQKANNLTVDGNVGKRTWAVLGPYLDKKFK